MAFLEIMTKFSSACVFETMLHMAFIEIMRIKGLFSVLTSEHVSSNFGILCFNVAHMASDNFGIGILTMAFIEIMRKFNTLLVCLKQCFTWHSLKS